MKIMQIDLWISNYEETVAFYQHTLELPLKSWNETEATFQVGNSVLKLIKDLEARNYYYHFAFNIHANMFQKAKSWLQERVTLSTEDGEDEVEFAGRFKATSCYFEDPAGNIVEYIARDGIAPSSESTHFSSRNVIEISEIGLTTKNILNSAEQILHLGILPQDGKIVDEVDYLNFMGEQEDGAYILLGPVGRTWFFSHKKSIESPVTIYTDRGIISNLF